MTGMAFSIQTTRLQRRKDRQVLRDFKNLSWRSLRLCREKTDLSDGSLAFYLLRSKAPPIPPLGLTCYAPG